jgi:hypothetical protein
MTMDEKVMVAIVHVNSVFIALFIFLVKLWV